MAKEKKLQIIKAAAKRFDRHGLNKTTLDEIARDLRIGKATLYHYFESKEELYFQVLDWEGELLVEDIKNIFSSKENDLTSKLNSYLSSKESLQQNYKLIYDTVINIVSDISFERENLFYSKLIDSEKKILLKFLNENKDKKEGTDVMAKVLIFQSLNNMFIQKLAPQSSEEGTNHEKEFFTKLFEEKLN